MELQLRLGQTFETALSDDDSAVQTYNEVLGGPGELGCTLLVELDRERYEAARRYLGYLPTAFDGELPVAEPREPAKAPGELEGVIESAEECPGECLDEQGCMWEGGEVWIEVRCGDAGAIITYLFDERGRRLRPQLALPRNVDRRLRRAPHGLDARAGQGGRPNFGIVRRGAA